MPNPMNKPEISYTLTRSGVSIDVDYDATFSKEDLVGLLDNPPKWANLDPKAFTEEIRNNIELDLSLTEIVSLIHGRTAKVYDIVGYYDKATDQEYPWGQGPVKMWELPETIYIGNVKLKNVTKRYDADCLNSYTATYDNGDNEYPLTLKFREANFEHFDYYYLEIV